MKATVLLIDDDPVDLAPLRMLLEGWEMQVVTARSGEEGLERLGEVPVDLVLTDVYLPGLSGEDVMGRVRDHFPGLPVILITGRGDVPSAVRAMRGGAFDYVLKPPDEEELRLTLERALEQGRLRRENAFLRAELAVGGMYGERLIGRGPAMQRVFELIDRAARADSTVLVTGETGTGKELVAQALHFRGDRATRPLVAFNCAAVAPSLAESELFGHERGAFTGAVATRRGRFEEADGGTLFLDEIAETSPAFQAKLLRVLQERSFERVGGSEPIRVDVRVVASTNRDLAAEIAAGRFREDLYYRLCVIPIHLPPLRERREDIPVLAAHFLTRYAGRYGTEAMRLSDAAGAFLAKRDWPGNVRELQHTIERAVVLARGPVLEPEGLVQPAAEGGAAATVDAGPTLEAQLEARTREYVLAALDRSGWNKTRAAERLGIDRTTLHRLIRRHRLARG